MGSSLEYTSLPSLSIHARLPEQPLLVFTRPSAWTGHDRALFTVAGLLPAQTPYLYRGGLRHFLFGRGSGPFEWTFGSHDFRAKSSSGSDHPSASATELSSDVHLRRSREGRTPRISNGLPPEPWWSSGNAAEY